MAQLLVVLVPLSEGREERALSPHVEAPRTAPHVGHHPDVCPACTLSSILGCIDEPPRLDDAMVRSVDATQFERRRIAFDFDMMDYHWEQSLSPGNEQMEYFGSLAAGKPGSQNTAGIKNEAVDALIKKIVFAKDRATLVAATKAMDRVLLWNHYVVPQYYSGVYPYARWDRFSHADPLPKYGISGLPSVWWWDAEKAAKTGGRS